MCALAQLVGTVSRNLKGHWFDSSHSTRLGCGFCLGLWVRAGGNQSMSVCLSVSQFLSLPLSLESINISLGEDLKNNACGPPFPQRVS